LKVWQASFVVAMEVFELSKRFPREELYSLTDQIRRSSRAVTSNISEAWEKRRYEASFIAKLCDASAEAAESQTWLAYASACSYVSEDETAGLSSKYDKIIHTLEAMRFHASEWSNPF